MQRDGQTTQNTPQDQLNTTVTPVNGAPAEENKLQFFCPTCKLPHKSNMPCPDFKSEIQVRIAIDSLRQAAQNPNNVISDPANYQFAMATLQERLRALARPPSDVS